MVKIFLHGVGVQFKETFYQQDGAQPHTANEVLDFLHEHFGDHTILNCFPQCFGDGWSWPPSYPELNPCNGSI
jgi:hypothetical protein